jgi:hypothetical protein
VFTLGGGDILGWASRGNIDAGRGAKTAISAPPALIVIGADGIPRLDASAAVAGSGIRAKTTEPEVPPGAVDLYAPNAEVIAGDAGLEGGRVTVAAVRVVGVDNIDVGAGGLTVSASAGDAAPVAVPASAGTVAASATQAAEEANILPGSARESAERAAEPATVLGSIRVELIGFGGCDAQGEGPEGQCGG